MCLCMCVCVCVCMHACVCVYVYVYMCMCACMHAYVCMCMCICVCVCVCMCACVRVQSTSPTCQKNNRDRHNFVYLSESPGKPLHCYGLFPWSLGGKLLNCSCHQHLRRTWRGVGPHASTRCQLLYTSMATASRHHALLSPLPLVPRTRLLQVDTMHFFPPSPWCREPGYCKL